MACNIEPFPLFALRNIKSWADAQRQPAPEQGGVPARGDAADPATNGTVPPTVSFTLVEQFW